jgi:outer membrane protein assembly factor BamB
VETWAACFKIIFILRSIGTHMDHAARLLLLALTCIPAYAQGPSTETVSDSLIWSHFGGNARHQSRTTPTTELPSLDAPVWIATGDLTINYIPIAQSGIVVDRKRVYTIATSPQNPGMNFAVAYNRFTGDFLWATPIPPTILDSWSTPAVDIQHNQLIVASSQTLTALDAATGSLNWSRDLDSIIVNASPTVTSDLGASDRVFITHYSFGGGSPAMLTCINLDPFHATNNPYQPGEIVWQAPLVGDSSGNTAAYSAGTVIVASASSPGSQAGQIKAYDATATIAPSPIWTFTNTINAGFFSGVAIARGHVYASSYAFSGLQFSANTVKLSKLSGQLVWSVPTNRTDATPVVLSNGDVVVSGGVPIGAFDFLPFFGSLPSIQYIADNGTSATLLWDSAIDTLDDTNSNGIWDFGESFLSIGGWTHQPITIEFNNTDMLLVGTLPETNPGVLFGHNTDIQFVDLSKLPTDPNFIMDHFVGTGSTPAMLGEWAYTPGIAGIHAFAPPPGPVFSASELIRRYTDGRLTLEELLNELTK